ncbi:MAG: hypothetical protein AABX82_06135 [Nanoarchaeota archaeon]
MIPVHHKKNILLLIIALLIGFLLSEAIVRIYAAVTDTTIASSEEKMCHKNIYEHVSDETDPYRFSPYFPDYLEYWEYYGIRPKANWGYGNVETEVLLPNGQTVRAIVYDMNTNGQHMRGIKEISVEKDANILRIAALGDSFTWGDDVPLLFSYPALLEELIPQTEVLNFGMTATGIDAMYFRWKYEALSFHPDVVLFAIYIDDIRRAYPCLNKPKISAEDGQLVITNMPPPSFREIYEEYEEPKTYSYFIEYLVYQLRYLGDVKSAEYNYGFEILEPILQEVKSQSEKDGTYFMVLIIEAGNDHINDAVEMEAIERLKNLLEETEISYTTANNIFAEENFTPTDYTHDRLFHFLPDGYAILAQGIVNKLEEERIISEQKDYSFTYDSDYALLTLSSKQNNSDVKMVVPFRFVE